jgi:hypothetical protein
MSAAVDVVTDVLMATYVGNHTPRTRQGTQVVAEMLIQALIDDGWQLTKINYVGPVIGRVIGCPPWLGDPAQSRE